MKSGRDAFSRRDMGIRRERFEDRTQRGGEDRVREDGDDGGEIVGAPAAKLRIGALRAHFEEVGQESDILRRGLYIGFYFAKKSAENFGEERNEFVLWTLKIGTKDGPNVVLSVLGIEEIHKI